jgi:hypothetical protein
MKTYDKEALGAAAKFAAHGAGIFLWGLFTYCVHVANKKDRSDPTYGTARLNFNAFGEMKFETYLIPAITGGLIGYSIYDIYKYFKSIK